MEKMTVEELTKTGYDSFKEREMISQRIQQLNININAIEAELQKREKAVENTRKIEEKML